MEDRLDDLNFLLGLGCCGNVAPAALKRYFYCVLRTSVAADVVRKNLRGTTNKNVSLRFL